jgi:hypothetical protein
MLSDRAPESSRSLGPLASLVAAADISGIRVDDVRALVRAGAVRYERIKGALYVDLDDVLRSGDGHAPRSAPARRIAGRLTGP